MSLKNRIIPERPVKLAGGDSIAARGLSLADISQIVLTHREDALALFGRIMDDKSQITVAAMANAAESMLITFPNIAAQAIACGTGDASAFEEARQLPAGDQIALLKEIGEMTFKMNGGSGNVVETIIRLINGASGSLASFNRPEIKA